MVFRSTNMLLHNGIVPLCALRAAGGNRLCRDIDLWVPREHVLANDAVLANDLLMGFQRKRAVDCDIFATKR